jgi:hypothetical protein
LIKAKGFREHNPVAERADRGEPAPGWKRCAEGDLRKKIPDLIEWRNLRDPWEEVFLTVAQDPSVTALAAPFAQCLREGTRGMGIVVSGTSPASSFMAQIALADATGRASDDDMDRRLPALYARCGPPYFGRIQEPLEGVARGLVEIGYVP